MLKIAYDDCYKYKLPPGHRFPMEKYVLLPQRLLEEGTVTHKNFFSPPPLAESIILQTHSPAYWHKLKSLNITRDEERQIGLPISQELVARGRVISHGTLMCCQYALGQFGLEHAGISMNIAGGTHHAYRDRGEGFCLLNDFAIAATHLLRSEQVRQILIVDLDVHQGNGNAVIFQNEPRVFTFSMHGDRNYPLRKEQSDLDIPLPDETDDIQYMRALKKHLPELLDRLAPDLVMYVAGVDVLASDRLGKLSLTLAGCRKRDEYVYQSCLSRQIPVAVSMAGGYSPDIDQIIEAHAGTFRAAAVMQPQYAEKA